MNFGGTVENLLKGIGASFLTNWFIAILLCVFVLALGMLFLGKWRTLTSSAPSLLTSIGILGTFAGIITGLLEFNPSELDSSIGPLLEGLKTAFTSSLVGMALSIIFKFISTLPLAQRSGPEYGEKIGVRHLYEATERQTKILKYQAEELTEQGSNINLLFNAVYSKNEKSINSQLASIRTGSEKFHINALNQLSLQNDSMRELINKISNDAESSLTGQLNLLRTDFNDGNKQIVKAMEGLLSNSEKANAQFQNMEAATVESSSSVKELTTLAGESLSSSRKIEEELVSTAQSHLRFHESLLSNIGLIHELVDKHNTAFADFDLRINKQFDRANEALATSPTEHVIDALKEVTREFNNIIVEQFGDNFKQLNQAVGQLLNWQDNYRVQLVEMDRQYNESVKAIQQSENSVSSISESAKVIPDHMRALEEILKANQAQVSDINSHLAAFSDLRDKAVESIPQTQNIINNLLADLETGNRKLIDGIGSTTSLMTAAISKSTDSFTQAASDSSSKLTAAADVLSTTGKSFENKSVQVIEDFSSFGKILVDQATRAREEVERGLEKSHENLIEEIQKSASMHSDKASNIHGGLQKTIEESLQQTGETIKSSIETQYEAMATARNQEVQRVMEQMGEALGTITGTFTEDYRKLVQAMADVVNHRPRQ